jgi:hypothetical protein
VELDLVARRMRVMKCPMCACPLSPDVMMCLNCKTDVSFKVIGPDGNRYGPYDYRHFTTYVADGSIPAEWHVRRGDGDPTSVQQMMAVVAPDGGATAPPPA